MVQPATSSRERFASQVGTEAQPQLLCTASGGYFRSLNSEWQRVLGWTSEDLTLRPIAYFVHPRDRERSVWEAAHVTQPGFELSSFENRFRARGGEWHWLRWTARADGATWVASAVDVTEEKRADALRDELQLPAGTAPNADVQGTVALELEALAAPRIEAAKAPRVPMQVPPAAVERPTRTRVPSRVIARSLAAVLAGIALGLAAAELRDGSLSGRPSALGGAQRSLPSDMVGPVSGAGQILGPSLGDPVPPAMFGPLRAVVR
jgi:PAS domain S-box-containing protein